MKPAELVELLGDLRPAVAIRAIRELAGKGEEAARVLGQHLEGLKGPQATRSDFISWQRRRNAVWTLTQIDSPVARDYVRSVGLSDREESVCLAAIHSVSVWRDRGALPRLLGLLKTGSPPLQRAAAEAVGRIGDKSAVPVLLEAASTEHDRILEHSLIYALIEIADPIGTAAGLRSTSSFTKKAALIALDQMDGGGLEPEMVTPLLASSDPVLHQTAMWISSHHPQWGSALVGFFGQRLALNDLSNGERTELERQLAQFAQNDSIQELLAGALSDSKASTNSQLTALHAMAQASLKAIPSAWINPLQQALHNPVESVIRCAIAVIRSVPASKTGSEDFTLPLLLLAHEPARSAELKLEALAALPTPLKNVEPPLYQFLCTNLNPEAPLMCRGTAASVLGKARLAEDQLVELCDKIIEVGPLELSKLLAAFERRTNETVGLKLVAALKKAKSLASIPVDSLKLLLAKFPASVQPMAAELLAIVDVDATKQQAHLDELLTGLKGGDIRRGQAVFNSQKTACSTCHAIGYLGGNVGPDLTRIGEIRKERDLLEAIVYPSASFVRSFEPMIVETKSGDVFSGVLHKDSPDEVVLVTGPNAEARINRAEIAEMRPGTVSVMPAGLDEQMSRQELSDLIAFLKANRK